MEGRFEFQMAHVNSRSCLESVGIAYLSILCPSHQYNATLALYGRKSTGL